MQVNSIFHVPDISAIGLWCQSKDIVLCYNIKPGSSKPDFQELSVSSDIKPFGHESFITYQTPRSSHYSQLTATINESGELSMDDVLMEEDIPDHSVTHHTCCGKY